MKHVHFAMILIVTVMASTPSAAPAKAVQIVTTTPTYADIARRIGGDSVKVLSIMRGPENPHHVIAKPSYMMKMRRADLFIHTGLDAEPWVPQLIKGARAKRFLPGGSGDVNVSVGVALLEVPKHNELSRALGDIHVYGNPHFTLDPYDGIIVARTIADALKRTDPAHAKDFEKNFTDFQQSVTAMTTKLLDRMAPYRGTMVISYHRFWPYLFARFGIVRLADVEPKPGIAPGPQHLTRAVETMKSQGVKIVLYETFSSKKNAKFVAKRAGGVAVLLSQEVNAVKGVDTYEKMFEYNINQILDAYKKTGVTPTSAPDETESATADPMTESITRN